MRIQLLGRALPVLLLTLLILSPISLADPTLPPSSGKIETQAVPQQNTAGAQSARTFLHDTSQTGITPYKPIPAADSGRIDLQEVTGTPQTAIPAAQSSDVQMKEIKPATTMEVKVTQSRTFRTKGRIIRVAVSDPTIAEPVVVSEHEFILIGKRDGSVTLMLWFDPRK